MRGVAMIINTLIFAASISALPRSTTHVKSHENSVAKPKGTYASILPKSLELTQKCGGFGKSITFDLSQSLLQPISNDPRFQWKYRNAASMDRFHWTYGKCTAQVANGLSFFSVHLPIVGHGDNKHLFILATGKSIDDSVNFKVCVTYFEIAGVNMKRDDESAWICNSPKSNIKTIGDALPDSLKNSIPHLVCGHEGGAIVEYTAKDIIKKTLNNGVVGFHSADFYAVTPEDGDFETSTFFEYGYGATKDCQGKPGLFQVLTTTVEYDKKSVTFAILALATTKRGVPYLQARDKLGKPDKICGFLLESLTGKQVHVSPEVAWEHCTELFTEGNK